MGVSNASNTFLMSGHNLAVLAVHHAETRGSWPRLVHWAGAVRRFEEVAAAIYE